MRVVLKRGADALGGTMTATAGTPVNLTAELTGGSAPVKSLWHCVMRPGPSSRSARAIPETLSYTFSGAGSYELLFSAFQEGTGLRASERITTMRAAAGHDRGPCADGYR
jgi:hypothetical protein